MYKGKIDLSKSGYQRFLGAVESEIMNYVWKKGSMSIREFVRSHGELHANTVTTIANRMVEKGLLKKERRVKGHRYEAVMTERLFKKELRKALEEVLMDLAPPTPPAVRQGSKEEVNPIL